MKKIILVTVMLLMVSWAFGDIITLSNGEKIEGEIKGKSKDKIYVYSQTLSRFIRISNESIISVTDDRNIDITEEILQRENFNDGLDFGNMYDIESRFDSKINHNKVLNKSSNDNINQDRKLKFKPFPLAVGISLFAIAYDSFSQASDLSKTIKDLDEIDENTSELKEDRTRKNVIGTLCLISSLVSVTASFERVEVKASPTSVSLGYRF